jgi:hypothetical protein
MNSVATLGMLVGAIAGCAALLGAAAVRELRELITLDEK